VDGVWECVLGGTIPVENFTEAELVVPRDAISDREFLEAMARKGKHKVLDEGTALLVCLTVKPEGQINDEHRQVLRSYDKYRGKIATSYLDYWNPGSVAFVEVRIAGPDEKQTRRFETDRGGLWLLTEGIDAVGLASTTVLLPSAISTDSVASLNHAYTKLSEALETWRISHTGNIYKRVLYQERNGTWYPLDILRDRTLEKQEQEIARNLWDEFMAKMTSQSPMQRDRNL